MQEKGKHKVKRQPINALETAEGKYNKTDALLRKSEEHYQTLLDTIPHGIQEIDTSGSIIFVNGAYNRIYGCEEGEVIGTSILDKLAHDSERDKLRDYLKRLLKDQPIPTPYFEKNRTKEGRIIDVQVDWNYMRDIKGHVVGFISVITDITERKKAEQELINYQNQLKSLASQLTLSEEKERKRLADSLHDEIGQELFGIKIKLEMLKDSLSSTEDTKTLGNVLNAIQQVVEHTRSLTVELSPPILYELGLEKALEWLAEQTHNNYGIMVTFEDDKREKPLDDDVKIFLYQAVRELLTNVVKHAQVKNARVSVKKDNSNIRICCEDGGVGFTYSQQGMSSDRKEGFGLFSIMERLDYFGGHLEIESQPDRGTHITLVAPLISC
jgi:PAS domain S-box-containing protein